MTNESQIKLNTSCISTVPLQNYKEDFTFIVNGVEFKTSMLKADLLSSNICKIHISDPSYDTFIINTQHKGNFSHLLNLFSFEKCTIPENELPFIIEVIEILGNKSIECQECTEVTLNNVLRLIEEHTKYSLFYSKRLSIEIEYAAENFHELLNGQDKNLKNLDIDILHSILGHPKLRLNNEDEIVDFLNDLYHLSTKYSELYEHVIFSNLSLEKISQFLDILDIEDMNQGTWKSLCFRLKHDIIEKSDMKNETSRYLSPQTKGETFDYSENSDFEGIINQLRNRNGNRIENVVDITSSSCQFRNDPSNVAIFEDPNSIFVSGGEENDWICFDFKEKRIIPTAYTIRSYAWGPNGAHPKSWVIEVSEDGSKWKIIDTQRDCPFLNGKRFTHTFKIKQEKEKKVRYFRFRATGRNWTNSYIIQIESFEIYGTLI